MMPPDRPSSPSPKPDENPIQRAPKPETPKPEMLEKADKTVAEFELRFPPGFMRTRFTVQERDALVYLIADDTQRALRASEEEVESLRAKTRALAEAVQTWQGLEHAARAEATKAERERCARIAEEHTEHIDFDTFSAREEPGGKVQSHEEPPFICNVAQAIRAEVMPDGCTCGATWPCPLHGGPPEPPSSPTPPTSPPCDLGPEDILARAPSSNFAKLLASGKPVESVDAYLDLDPEPTPPSEEPRPRSKWAQSARSSNFKVGCERPDGTLNIHLESEGCEVCEPAVPSPEPPREEPR